MPIPLKRTDSSVGQSNNRSVQALTTLLLINIIMHIIISFVKTITSRSVMRLGVTCQDVLPNPIDPLALEDATRWLGQLSET